MRAPRLTDTQKREIVRLRSAGRQFKEIARVLLCTPDAAKSFWHRFHDRSGRREVERRSKRINRGMVKILQGRKIVAELTLAEQQVIASRVLAAEIAMAQAEALTAPPFKAGDLTW